SVPPNAGRRRDDLSPAPRADRHSGVMRLGLRQGWRVHARVIEVLTNRFTRIGDAHARHVAAGVELGAQTGIDPGPVRREIQLPGAGDDLVAQLRVKVHAVLIDDRLDRTIVAFRL